MVPTVTDVVRGANVNLILKADQPTGRTVSGTVQDLLTRGNHPRGIKVRLADGRIGRVQSLVAGNGSSTSSSSGSGTSIVGSAGVRYVNAGHDYNGDASSRHHRDRRGHGQQQDVRNAMPLPQQQIGLDAYIKPAKVKRGKGVAPAMAGVSAPASRDGVRWEDVRGADTANSVGAKSMVCPVCDEFQGDETAVARHVDGHFGDG